MQRKIYWLHTYNPSIENAGVFMFQLVEELNKSNHQVTLFYIGRTLREYVNSYKELKKIIRKEDIVHAQYGSFCGFFTSLLPGYRILSLRGSDWYIAPEKKLKNSIHNYLAHFFTVISLRRFDNIIVMSNRMKTEIENKYSIENIVVIPDGINLNKFFPISREVAREEFGEPTNINKWILFSTLNKDNYLKRAWLAEEAVNILKKKMPNVELKVMNGIPHDKVNQFVNCCDVILLTSTHEGYPNIIKEGLACNKPFVATDVSDLKIIAVKESEFCKVVLPDVQEIADALYIVLTRENNSDLRKWVSDMNIVSISRRITDLYNNYLLLQ